MTQCLGTNLFLSCRHFCPWHISLADICSLSKYQRFLKKGANEGNVRKKPPQSRCDLHGKTFVISKLIAKISSNAELGQKSPLLMKSGHFVLWTKPPTPKKEILCWGRWLQCRSQNLDCYHSISTERWVDTFPASVTEQVLQNLMWVIQILPTFCIEQTGEMCSVCHYPLASCL